MSTSTSLQQAMSEAQSREIVFKYQAEVKRLGGKGELGLPLGKFKWEFRQFFTHVKTNDELEHLVKLMDRDQNGYISLDELIAFLMLDPLSETYKEIKGEKIDSRERPKGYRYSIDAGRPGSAGNAGAGSLPPLSGKRPSILKLAPAEFNMAFTGSYDHYNKAHTQKQLKEEEKLERDAAQREAEAAERKALQGQLKRDVSF